MNSPAISVLIPLYNAEKFIAQAIESVLQQTFTDFEIIIVDNFSTDTSFEIARKYTNDNRVKLFQNPQNIGMVRNWNQCILYATGKYTVGQLAEHYVISDRQVHTILRGEQWRDVGGPLVPATHGHIGQANAQAKLDEAKVRVIRSMAANGMSQYAIAKDIQVSQAAVSKVLTRRTWAHVI